MDFSLKFKRALATLSTVALLVSNASVVFAQTFNDVPTNSWYYDYVEQLVDDGIIDTATHYRPNDAVNRAELVKIVITVIDGLSGYEAPATPTFDDVSPAAWYYDYVEAAAQLDIVGGYTDTAGNPTGKFGPGDTTTRAAATKILVNSFAVPTDLNPSSPFPDVLSGTWFYDYVITAYNQSILDGYANGRFGPADPVTRAQIAKLVVNSQNPVERGTGTPTPTPVSSEGALELSLNDQTPNSVTVPTSASNVKLLAVDFTAADDDVVVTNLVVTRGGVGNSSDWANLYLYEGAERLTTGRTLNNDTNTATFPVNFTVDAGTTTTIWVVGEMSGTGTPNNQHYFYVASASDVTSNAQSTAGDFPVAGNTFTTGGVGVNSVTATVGSAIAQPLIGGMDQEISSFKLTAGSTNNIALHSIALTQNGSLDSSKLTNLKLLRGSDVVATAAGFTGDLVTFVLDTPFVIDEGQNKTFYVRANIDGGRTTDTVQIYLDENTDLVAIDQQYGFGAVVTNSTFNTTGVTATNLKGGEVTVTDNGPAATQISQNATNVQLLNYSITSGRDLRVKDMESIVTLVGPGATSPDTGVLGADTVVAGTGAAVAATGTSAVIGDLLVTADTAGAAANGTTLTIIASAVDASGIVVSAETATTITLTVETGGGATPDPIWSAVVTAANAGLIFGATVTSPTNGADTVLVGDAQVITLAGGADAGTSTTSVTCVTTTTGIVADDMVSMPTAGGTVYAIATAVTAGTGANGCAGGATTTRITTNNTAATALTVGGTVQEVNPYSLIKNFKVVDLDSGSTLQGPITRVSDATASGATNTTYSKAFTEDYTLIGGETRHLSVQADIDQNMPSGYSLFVKIDYQTLAGSIKDDSSNENILSADIVGGVLTGKTHTTAANSLTVAKASTPSSQTFVKGETDVPALGIAFTAGDAGSISIKKIIVRAYADDDGTFEGAGLGDIAANTVVSSITLYDGNNIIAGPKSISLVDVSGGTYSAGVDYYRAIFDNLNLVIPNGGTKTLTAKVKLLNNASATQYLALDIVPISDITAEDKEANTITAQSATDNLNLAAIPATLITILTNGTLSAAAQGSPEASIIVAGKTMQLVSKYKFNALRESFTVNKLTVVNDATGPFGDPITTNAISQVILKYPDINGVMQTKTGEITTGGSATISNLGFYVAKGTDAYVEIYADIVPFSNEDLSGRTIRLGLKDTSNSITTLEAIGESSSITVDTDSELTFANPTDVKTMLIKRTKPTFAQASNLGTNLTLGVNSDNRLYGITVTADSAGSVTFGRFSFVVTNGTAGTLGTFKLWKGEDLYDIEANIWNATALGDLEGGGTIATLQSNTVIVSFNSPETVTAGTSSTYYLDAIASNVTADQSVSTVLASGDGNVELTGFAANPNSTTESANMAKIHHASDATLGLFSTSTDFRNVIATTPGGQSALIIWSDDSDVNTSGYPTIAANDGDVTSDTGYYDFTNGYLLKTNTLSTFAVRE